MASNTNVNLRDAVLYSVFVRDHTPEGTFRALESDLDRLRSLGVDILWLMPIHPIGEVNRKGSVGSPYAIRDYRAVNPDMGTVEDLQHLVGECHKRGMRLIIDVVYNHTSPDSVLAHDHPEFFLRDENGNPTRRVADWSDIVDLDYRNAPLWDYQIETLVQWAKIVDGFRCDVASSVPLAFWCRAREAVAQVRPDAIWLAESVHGIHNRYMRAQGAVAVSDGDLYRAFDMTYDYDIWPHIEEMFEDRRNFKTYLHMLNMQEAAYTDNYVKLRCFENHDQPRLASRVTSEEALHNYLAMLYFLRGTTLLYSGMEFAPRHQVSLFEKEDSFAEKNEDLQEYLRTLRKMKAALPLSASGFWAEEGAEGIAVMYYDCPTQHVRGVFSPYGCRGSVKVDLPDGEYENLLGGMVTVKNGTVAFEGKPLVFGN